MLDLILLAMYKSRNKSQNFDNQRSLLSLELRVLALEEIIVEKDECLASLRKDFDDFKRLITDSISNNHPMQINQLLTSNDNANQINKDDSSKLEHLNNLAIEQEEIVRRQVYGKSMELMNLKVTLIKTLRLFMIFLIR